MEEEKKVLDLKESFASRKFAAFLIAIILLTAVLILGFKFSIVAALYTTYVGAILGALTVYLGGNISEKWVVGNANVNAMKTVAKPDQKKVK